MHRSGKNLAWTIEWDSQALRDLRKLDRPVRREILDYMDYRVATAECPRSYGKALSGDRADLWRYRVRDYRILCEIEDRKLVVYVIEVGHRSKIYDS